MVGQTKARGAEENQQEVDEERGADQPQDDGGSLRLLSTVLDQQSAAALGTSGAAGAVAPAYAAQECGALEDEDEHEVEGHGGADQGGLVRGAIDVGGDRDSQEGCRQEQGGPDVCAAEYRDCQAGASRAMVHSGNKDGNDDQG
jgi:hypothetical protein